MSARISLPSRAFPYSPLSRAGVGAWISGYNPSGMIPLARRVATTDTINALRSMGTMGGGSYGMADLAAQLPIRLLCLLLDSHPFARRANENDAAIAFGLSSQSLVVVKDYADGTGTIDDSETLYVNRLWERHPSLSLVGLLKLISSTVNGAAWPLFEAVLGADGVEDFYDIDGLTCYYAEPKDGGSKRTSRGRPRIGYSRGRAVYQRKGWGQNVNTDTELPTGPDGTVLSLAWGASSENPYGVPRYAAALGELLCDLEDEKDIGEWLSRVGLSQVAWEAQIEPLLAFVEQNQATELIDDLGNPITLSQWLRAYIDGLSDDVEARRAGQSIVAAGAKPTAVSANPGTALPTLRQQRLVRLCASMLQPPALMVGPAGGNAFGSTSSVEWDAYAQQLEMLREFCFRVPVWLANLDLRARGVDMVARMDSEPIRAADLKAYYEAQGVHRENLFALVRAGMLDEEEVAMKLTGTGIVNPERAAATFDPAPEPTNTVPTGNNGA